MTSYFDKTAAFQFTKILHTIPDSKVHGANMGPTWVLSAPGGPHVGPMNFAIWASSSITSLVTPFEKLKRTSLTW